jgi:hypothetical protein
MRPEIPAVADGSIVDMILDMINPSEPDIQTA